MYCHYVPQVYQRSWKNIAKNNDEVYLFKKEKGFRYPKPIKIENNFQESNYYILKLFSLTDERFNYLEFFKKDIEQYYIEKLSIYDIFLDGCKISDFLSFFKQLHSFDSLEFWKDGLKQSTRKLKNNIETWWDKNISKIIERFFSCGIENKWNKVLNSIIDLTTSQTISNQCLDDLSEFMAIQSSRDIREKNLRDALLQSFEIIEIVLDEIFNKIPEAKEKLYSDDFAREVWLNQLLIHIKNPAKDNVIGTLKKNYSSCLFFFIKANRVKFITTNYPVQRLKLKDNNTIIMTLNKEYCVMLAKNPSQPYKRYQVCNASDNIVKYINYILSQGATSLINDYNYYEKSQSLPQKDFEIMFNRAGYLNIFKGQ